VGFPDVFYDEGVYMRRAMHVLSGFGPQELFEGVNPYYDHPYFGQLFLAGVFKVIGYPNFLLNPSSSDSNILHSIQTLYLVPRILFFYIKYQNAAITEISHLLHPFYLQ
jgi:hypothetical protein